MSRISGSPGSIPISASTGIRRSPKASHCSRESQISLTRRLPSCAEADVVLHPLGGKATGLRQTPDTLVVLLGRQGRRGEADKDAHLSILLSLGVGPTLPDDA